MNATRLILALAITLEAAAADAPSHRVRIDSVLVTPMDQADVPAREAGVLTTIAVREGQMVAEGELLAQIDETEAQLTKERAAIELEIALKEAANESAVRFAEKTLEMAEAEARRAGDAVERFRKSVSQTELDQLQRAVERGGLEIEQARHDLEVARLKSRLKENELKAAERNLERRRIVAPIAGVVVEIKGRRGEWVEPGETVARIVRLDTLRAEGFAGAREVNTHSTGAPVTLTIDLPGQPRAEFAGELAFVSPEIDPVNGQVRVWAQVVNRELLLRPGLRATMVIDPPAGAAPPVQTGRSQ